MLNHFTAVIYQPRIPCQGTCFEAWFLYDNLSDGGKLKKLHKNRDLWSQNPLILFCKKYKYFLLSPGKYLVYIMISMIWNFSGMFKPIWMTFSIKIWQIQASAMKKKIYYNHFPKIFDFILHYFISLKMTRMRYFLKANISNNGWASLEFVGLGWPKLARFPSTLDFFDWEKPKRRPSEFTLPVIL